MDNKQGFRFICGLKKSFSLSLSLCYICRASGTFSAGFHCNAIHILDSCSMWDILCWISLITPYTFWIHRPCGAFLLGFTVTPYTFQFYLPHGTFCAGFHYKTKYILDSSFMWDSLCWVSLSHHAHSGFTFHYLTIKKTLAD